MDKTLLFENILQYRSINPVPETNFDLQPDISFSSHNHEVFHETLLSILKSNSGNSKSIIFSTNRIKNGKRRATGGLADRFKGLASAVLWSIGANRSFKLDWTHPFRLDQIYDFPFEQIKNKGDSCTIDLIDRNRVNNLPTIMENGILSFTPDEDEVFFHSNSTILQLLKLDEIREKFPNVDFDMERQPAGIGNQELMSSILSIFRIIPNEEESVFLCSFLNLKKDYPSTIGLQFRTGGEGEWKDPEWGNPDDIHKLVEHIESKLPEENGKSLVYLATDSKKAKENLLSLSHPRLRLLCSNGPIAHMDRSSGELAIQGSRFAIIENHLLGLCDKIYTVHGGFARLAGFRANKPVNRIPLKKPELAKKNPIMSSNKKNTPTKNNIMSEKILSKKNKFLYIGVPKAATRSILSVLRREEFSTTEFNEPISSHLENNPDYKDFFIFSFVRNPWSRILSTWRNKIANPDKKAPRVILNRYEDLYYNMPFEEFVNFVCDSKFGNDELGDRHWTSQYLFLEDRQGNLVPDFIGRLESLEVDFSYALSKIGFEHVSLPWLNTRRGWSSDAKTMLADSKNYYREFYTSELERKISERYKKDISYFDYEF